MKYWVSKILYIIAFTIKIICTVILITVTGAFDVIYPFSIFTPFFLAAIAYAGPPRWLLLLLLIVLGAFVVSLCVFPILMFWKDDRIKPWVTILQGFYLVEALSLLFSMLFGEFAFMKFVGSLFNLAIIITLSQMKRPSE